jgi:hypothetical protein
VIPLTKYCTAACNLVHFKTNTPKASSLLGPCPYNFWRGTSSARSLMCTCKVRVVTCAVCTQPLVTGVLRCAFSPVNLGPYHTRREPLMRVLSYAPSNYSYIKRSLQSALHAAPYLYLEAFTFSSQPCSIFISEIQIRVPVASY